MANKSATETLKDVAKALEALAQGQADMAAALAARPAAAAPAPLAEVPAAMAPFLERMLEMEKSRTQDLRDKVADLQSEVLKERQTASHHEMVALNAASSNEVKLAVVQQAGKIVNLIAIKYGGPVAKSTAKAVAGVQGTAPALDAEVSDDGADTDDAAGAG